MSAWNDSDSVAFGISSLYLAPTTFSILFFESEAFPTFQEPASSGV